MPCSFFKKKSSSSSVSKNKRGREKRKLTKSRILKIVHSFSKLGAFGHALSLFLKKKKSNQSSISQKKNLKKKKNHHA